MEQSTKDILKMLGRAAFQMGKDAAPSVVTRTIFSKLFGHRIQTPVGTRFLMSDFNGLYRQKYNFETNHKTKLTGYVYYRAGSAPKALIVFAHGFGGGGQISYLDIINALTERNYCVFAYDATGNDESEGDSVNGFVQQVIDLESAIKFIKTVAPYNSLPLVLFGHSMGAYSVCNVLNFYPNVKAVVAASGFNKSSDIVIEQAKQWTGEDKQDIGIYIAQEETRVFGKYASTTAVEGIGNTNAKVLIIHSEDDPVIPLKAGFGIYYNAYQNDNRVQFIKLKDKGHGTVFYSDIGKKYSNQINNNYKNLLKEKALTEQDKINFQSTIDRSKYANLVDSNLFDKIQEFIDSAIDL